VHDTLHLAVDLSLPQQIFAELTNYDIDDPACVGQGGRLGLGIDPFTLDYVGNDRPSFATSLLAELTRQLPFPVFSLNINAFDDFITYGYYPDIASSEIIFGGVNHAHYEGCIEWHTPSYIPGTDVLWNIGLDRIVVENTTIPMHNAIILDSTISNLIGLPNDVGRYADANDIACYQDGFEGDGLFPIDCDDPNGFDSASIDCDRRLADMEFVLANGHSYTLTHEDLVVLTYIDLIGFMCMVRISADPDVPGWMLGQIFFHRHYIVFNVENRNIGLARSTSGASSALCEADRAMDISSYAEDAEEVEPIDAASHGSETHSFGAGGAPAVDINAAPLRNETMAKSSLWRINEREDELMVLSTAAGFAAVMIVMCLMSLCRRRMLLRQYQRTDLDETDMTKEEEEFEESQTELL
jgi:Eukaryotic aspartyl protease